MAEDPDRALQSVMHALAASALRTNLTRCDVLDAALSALEHEGLDDVQLRAAERAAHQLVGSAGTFGFPRVSELAADLEQYLSRVATSGGPVPGEPVEHDELVRARRWLTQMQVELQSGSAGDHQPAG